MRYSVSCTLRLLMAAVALCALTVTTPAVAEPAHQYEFVCHYDLQGIGTTHYVASHFVKAHLRHHLSSNLRHRDDTRGLCPQPLVETAGFQKVVSDYVTCQPLEDGNILCILNPQDSNKRLNLKTDVIDLITTANALVDENSVFAFRLYGGQGGFTADAGGGKGGYAQVTTTFSDYYNAYGTWELTYLVGQDAGSDSDTGKGGSSSMIFYGKPDESASCTMTEDSSCVDTSCVIAIAGGGGGATSTVTTTFNGADGLVAISDSGHAALAEGTRMNGCGGLGGGVNRNGDDSPATRFSNASRSGSMGSFVGNSGKGRDGNWDGLGGGGGGFGGGERPDGANAAKGGGSYAAASTVATLQQIRNRQNNQRIDLYIVQYTE